MSKENDPNILFVLLFAMLLATVAGCYNSPLAWRGVINYNNQHVTTEGKADNNAKSGAVRIDATKTTDIDATTEVKK